MDARELRRILVLANAFKEGDLLVGGTRDDGVRVEAKQELLSLRVADIRRTVLIDDGVTALLARGRERSRDPDLDPLTVAQLKSLLLGPGCASWARVHHDALPSQVVAAVVKTMTDDELASVSGRLFNPLPGDGVAIGGGDEAAA